MSDICKVLTIKKVPWWLIGPLVEAICIDCRINGSGFEPAYIFIYFFAQLGFFCIIFLLTGEQDVEPLSL